MRLETFGVVAMALGLAACTCSGSPTGGETHPYVRCAVADVPDRELETAGAYLRIAASEITIEPHGSARVAFVRGPATAGEPFAPALDGIEAAAPSAIVLVGDVGEGDAEIRATLEGLASLDAPTLVLLGGRDRPGVVRPALASVAGHERLVDLSGVRAVRIGALVLVPAPGAPDGRYAVDDEACGLGADDVEAIGDRDEEGEHRVLLAWAAPATGTASSRGLGSIEAGSPLLADLSSRLGATGFVASFGATGAVAEGWDVRIAVPPAVGRIELADGSRPTPGPIVLEVGDAGLTIVR